MKKILVFSADNEVSTKASKMFYKLAIKEGFDIVTDNPDIVISIGGDGTMLKAIREYKHFEVPFVGINAGNLGFLPNVSHDEVSIIRLLDALYKEEYLLMSRPTLKVIAKAKNEKVYEDFAFNEVIVKYDDMKMMVSDIYLDDYKFNKFAGDGFVVSTPLGSTGYAIWAGASVINAELPVYQLTPINPNNSSINNPLLYPLVISEEQKLKFIFHDKFSNKTVIGCDGSSFMNSVIDSVEISVNKEKIKIVEWNDYNYWQVFKSKILDKRKDI
ncbi:MAG: hypothetical protein CSB15_01235 [Clostridiales bacterium]|nr:MAG: hypothetical protein CSB15_01235 [Clostridiales bacterium]